jgi:hypothetical protein
MTTKIKFFITLAFLSFLAVVGGTFLLTAGRNIGQIMFGSSFAEGQLKEYVAKVLQQDVQGMSCRNVDTDNNGYVACDFTTVQNPTRTQTIECAAWGWEGVINRGCKARLPQIN